MKNTNMTMGDLKGTGWGKSPLYGIARLYFLHKLIESAYKEAEQRHFGYRDPDPICSICLGKNCEHLKGG